jgi:hypothetical protein
VKIIKQNALLVALEEEDPATIKALSKNKEQLAWYKDQVAGKNEAIRYAVDNFWTFSQSKEFVPYKKALTLMKSGKYVMLQFGTITIREMQGTGTGSLGGPVGWRKDNQGNLSYNPQTKKIVPIDNVTTLQIVVPKKDYGAIITNMPSDIPSKADAVYGIQQLQYVLNFVDSGKKIKEIEKQYSINHAELKDKVLLFDKDDLDDEVNEQLIKKYYSYPFEITSLEKINEAILSKDKRYAYVQLVPLEGGKKVVNNHYVCSAEDGKIYAVVEKKTAFTVAGNTIGVKQIKAKHIKEYANL